MNNDNEIKQGLQDADLRTEIVIKDDQKLEIKVSASRPLTDEEVEYITRSIHEAHEEAELLTAASDEGVYKQ